MPRGGGKPIRRALDKMTHPGRRRNPGPAAHIIVSPPPRQQIVDLMLLGRIQVQVAFELPSMAKKEEPNARVAAQAFAWESESKVEPP